MATSLDKSGVLNEPRERTSDDQRWGALYDTMYFTSLCTRLQNYTIGTSLLSIRIRIPTSNIPF